MRETSERDVRELDSSTEPGGPPHYDVTSVANVLALCSYAVRTACRAVPTATGKLMTAATCRHTRVLSGGLGVSGIEEFQSRRHGRLPVRPVMSAFARHEPMRDGLLGEANMQLSVAFEELVVRADVHVVLGLFEICFWRPIDYLPEVVVVVRVIQPLAANEVLSPCFAVAPVVALHIKLDDLLVRPMS